MHIPYTDLQKNLQRRVKIVLNKSFGKSQIWKELITLKIIPLFSKNVPKYLYTPLGTQRFHLELTQHFGI